MAKYDVVRIENRAGGYSEHLGEINAPTLESAQDRASVEYECPESCRLVVSECESEETPAKHTPGPWIFCGTHVDDSRGLPLVRSSHRDFDKINCADFHLIAAAPELLEALRYARRFVDPENCDVAFIDAAIAKARGV